MKTMMLALAAGLSLIAVQANADVKSQIVNAETHAGLAVQATAIEGVHMHLHHALNCLVGPTGAGFDAKQMNPCAQSGKGIIPDTMDATKKAGFEAAAAKARAGLADDTLTSAQKTSADLADMLKKAE